MQNFMTYKKSKHAGSGMNSGIAFIVLQSISNILTKESRTCGIQFTQLKAMYSAFIGKTLSLGNFVKMVGDGE